MKVVYKYGTGDKIPEGAIYLCTKTEDQILIEGNIPTGQTNGGGDHNVNMNITKRNQFVWHYFLVEVKEKEN